jgi:hypothetical protein
VKENIVIWNIQEHFMLDMKISNSLIILQTRVETTFVYINQMYLINLENIMNVLNYVCFLQPMNTL